MNEPKLPPSWSRHPVSYEERIVAFFDVLGWKDLISRADGDPARLGELRALVGFYGRLQEEIRGDPHGAMITAFSDNVIVSQPYRADAVQNFVDTMGRFQFAAATDGFFVRGAITVGPLFHDETSVFGPALIRSYELESTAAINPRVILDPDCADRLGRPRHVQMSDGYATVDTFGADFVRECATPSAGNATFLPAAIPRTILNKVEASLSETTEDKVRKRLIWLKEQVEAGIVSLSRA